MKVYRYMGKNEFQNLLHGQTLKNNTVYSSKGYRSGSAGFCFLPEIVVADGATFNPVESFSFLSGIVSPEFFVEFEIIDASFFVTSTGVYRNPRAFDDAEMMNITELCLSSYDYRKLCPIRFLPKEGLELLLVGCDAECSMDSVEPMWQPVRLSVTPDISRILESETAEDELQQFVLAHPSKTASLVF